METEKQRSETDKTNQLDNKNNEYIPETPSWAEEDNDSNNFNFLPGALGDMSKVPCAKSTWMNAFGSGLTVGLAYNLATSKSPQNVVLGTMATVLFTSWTYCRYNYRKRKCKVMGNTY